MKRLIDWVRQFKWARRLGRPSGYAALVSTETMCLEEGDTFPKAIGEALKKNL